METVLKEYKCFADWSVDGVIMCHAGGIYQVRPATGEGEEGYCDVLGCNDGNTLETSYLEVDEYMSPVEAAK